MKKERRRNQMKFRDFARQVQKKVGKLCGEGYRIKIETIQKNNSVTRKGMSIRKEGEDSASVIYLDSYYVCYENDEMSLEGVAEDIYEVFVRNETPAELKEALNDFQKIKDRVVCCLVNRESNEALLEDVPWVPFCDLAVVFHVLFKEEREGSLSSLIHHEQVKAWNTSVDELRRLAGENTPRLRPYRFRSMLEIIREMNGLPVSDGEEAGPGEKAMYVLSNKSGVHGAAAVLYDNALRDISEKLGADFVILPSSIHEMIVLPYDKSLRMKELGEIVEVINETEVSREDRLSDHVYLYSRRTGAVTIASDTEAA